VEVGLPNEEERLSLLQSLFGASIASPRGGKGGREGTSLTEEHLKDLAKTLSGSTGKDIRSLASVAGAAAVRRVCAEQHPGTSRAQEHIAVQKEDLDEGVKHAKKRQNRAIGAPQVPSVRWSDVGGLEDVKRAILDTVQLPLQHKALFVSGLRQRSGVLLYGPPGTGKTLLAKAVATECSLNFLSVKGPELINMYIGESEKNVREVFERARRAKPCVVFFDELDALAPARGVGGDSGGVMDRVVSQLLAELDGMQGGEPELFVMGASNRPDLIDTALLRPGRFDRLLYVGVSNDIPGRARIIQALTRKFDMADDLDLEEVSRACPPRATGADMYGLCSAAWLQAVRRHIASLPSSSQTPSNLDSMEGSDARSTKVVVTAEDFKDAVADLRPSLSEDELLKYERLRATFQGQQNG
ncbi:hypothetical protein CYMTET_17657, partial [Cymbomonas tetramitiformis]